MKISSQPLRPSPYRAYRDPQTGQWLIDQRGEDSDNVKGRKSVQNNDENPQK